MKFVNEPVSSTTDVKSETVSSLKVVLGHILDNNSNNNTTTYKAP